VAICGQEVAICGQDPLPDVRRKVSFPAFSTLQGAVNFRSDFVFGEGWI